MLFPLVAAMSACQENIYCIHGTPEGKTITFTIHSAATGWTAFGIGENMKKATVVMGWKNSTGGYTLSTRTSSGHFAPSVSEQQDSIQVPLAVPAPSWATMAFSFQRPLDGIASSTNYIWAQANSQVSNVDTMSSSPAMHTQHGFVKNVDFTVVSNSTTSIAASNGILKLPSGYTFEFVLMLHAVMMLFAWILAPFIGIFIARNLKNKIPRWWFSLHVFIMVFGVGVTSVGAILLVFLYASNRDFDSPHKIMGLLVTIVFFIQVALGVTAHIKYDPGRAPSPTIDKLHWWVGRLNFIMALVTVGLGFKAYGQYAPLGLELPIVAGVMVAFGVIGTVLGELALWEKEPEMEDYKA